MNVSARLQALADVLVQAVVCHEPDGSLGALNATAERLLECRREDVLGRTWTMGPWTTVDREAREVDELELPGRRTLATGENIADTLLGIRAGGRDRIVWVNANSVLVPAAGKRSGSALVVLEPMVAVSQVHPAVAELDRVSQVPRLERQFSKRACADARHRALFDQSNSAMLLIHPITGRILDANEAHGRRPPTDYRSATMQALMAQAQKAASQAGIVLLLGESGTGKDHIARWIHKNSPRADGPFFAINCAALPRELAESELFGHEPGAFTGSRGRKRGLLELAEKGTLLLDEIGELDLALQSKLLTFLDTRHIMRIGGERSIRVEARLIAATNRDLEAEVERGTFRRDLFYRLNVFPLRLPPLRERVADLPMLIEEILDRLTEDLGLARRPVLQPDVLDVLEPYPWPGNVRELRNVLERALMLSPAGIIRRDHVTVAPSVRDWQVVIGFPENESLHDVTRSVARKLVIEALRRGKGKQEAARLLGISRHALAHQLRSLGLEE